MKITALAIIISSIVILAGCGSDSSVTVPGENVSITSFYFSAEYNEGLGADIVGAINGTTISVSVPDGTDVTVLVPTIEFDGDSISLPSGISFDFSNPVNITVTGATGVKKTYTTVVYEGGRNQYPFFTANANTGITIDGTYNRKISDNDCSIGEAVEAFGGNTNIISLSAAKGFTANRKCSYSLFNRGLDLKLRRGRIRDAPSG